MRTLTGIGTPKGLQGRIDGAFDRIRGQLAGLSQVMNALAASLAQIAGILERVFMRTRRYAAA